MGRYVFPAIIAGLVIVIGYAIFTMPSVADGADTYTKAQVDEMLDEAYGHRKVLLDEVDALELRHEQLVGSHRGHLRWAGVE
jgi:hypothetical protein